jgi:probable rRNA maturation factor
MDLELQIAVEQAGLPLESDFTHWVTGALKHLSEDLEDIALCIRIVGEKEVSTLNKSYRDKDGPTNVLSFPANTPEFVVAETKEKPLGDIVLCAPLVGREASAQGKESAAHWAHLTVHGVLHLLKYDHEDPKEAERMEAVEIAILEQLGFANPY